jgi:hypothetical protein
MGISARKITISTVGMHKAIEKLADELDLPSRSRCRCTPRTTTCAAS